MTTLHKLRRSGHWEVDLVSMPGMKIEGTELAGILLVVDRKAGTVRQAAPVQVGEPLGLAVAQAASAPARPHTPSRPLSIRCHPALREEIAEVAGVLGARLMTTDDLPALNDAAESLRRHFGPVPVLLPSNPEPWRPVLEDLHRLAPWRALPDSVCFHFPSGCTPLRNAVAVVLGQAGEQLGLAVYPTQQDYDRFMTLADAGKLLDVGPWEAWAVHLDALHELPPEQREACIEQNLVMDDFGLLLLAMDGEHARPLTETEEYACLVALQGILGAFERQGDTLNAQPTVTPVPIAAGELTVVSTPSAPSLFDLLETPLLEEQHQVLIGTSADDPTLVLKMGKRDAERLARQIEGTDALYLETFGDMTDVVAWAGDLRLGVLTRGAFGEEPWSGWRARGSGRLVVSAGGPKRRTLRPRDVVATFEVVLLEDAEEDGVDS